MAFQVVRITLRFSSRAAAGITRTMEMHRSIDVSRAAPAEAFAWSRAGTVRMVIADVGGCP